LRLFQSHRYHIRACSDAADEFKVVETAEAAGTLDGSNAEPGSREIDGDWMQTLLVVIGFSLSLIIGSIWACHKFVWKRYYIPPAANGDKVPVCLELEKGEDPERVQARSITLPTVDYAKLLATSRTTRNKALAVRWKANQKNFRKVWQDMDAKAQTTMAADIKGRVTLAVSSYFSDTQLFEALCPEVAAHPDQFVALMERAVAKKLADPRTGSYVDINKIVEAAAVARGETKEDRATLKGFLPTIRGIVVLSFLDGVLETLCPTVKNEGEKKKKSLSTLQIVISGILSALIVHYVQVLFGSRTLY
jgi:hypothetical protein